MNAKPLRQALSFQAALLRSASWLVPGQYREEWLAEWKSELWYVRRAHENQPREGCVTSFSLGAFNDALSLRFRGRARSKHSQLVRLGSPSKCLGVLSTLAAMNVGLCFLVPGSRHTILPSPYPDARHLVVLTRSGFESGYPTISVTEFRSWTKSRQPNSAKLAFYEPTFGSLSSSSHQGQAIPIALASENLFRLLKVPIGLPLQDRSHGKQFASLVLSDRAWRVRFAQDPRTLGSIVEISGRRARVVAIIPDDLWRLPGQVEAWLLLSDEGLARLPVKGSEGFVLAHFKVDAPRTSNDEPREITLSSEGGGSHSYGGGSLATKVKQPVVNFLLEILMACLTLPALTSFSLGEYPASRSSTSLVNTIRQWLFFATKILLILPTAFCGSLVLANVADPQGQSVYLIQMLASYGGCLFGLCWALCDQRQRCPTCLQSLTNPAHVGHASRNFLAWSGTELVCANGHGLLHVPETSTSWFSKQRWLYLDHSWRELFPLRP